MPRSLLWLLRYVSQPSKFLLATNSKPTVHGTDHAIWRRIHLITFDVTFLQKDQDKKLIEKLTTELPGILNWALHGGRAYPKHRSSAAELRYGRN